MFGIHLAELTGEAANVVGVLIGFCQLKADGEDSFALEQVGRELEHQAKGFFVIIEGERAFDDGNHFVPCEWLRFLEKGGGSAVEREATSVGTVDGFDIDQLGARLFPAMAVENEDGEEGEKKESGLHHQRSPKKSSD